MKFRSTSFVLPAVAVAAAASALIATTARAGGWALFVDLPRAGGDDPALKESVLTFRAVGCHGPGTVVTATAEGIVDGKRVSLPLHPVEVPAKADSFSTPVYGVRREWPGRGRWVISLTARRDFTVYGRDGKPTGEHRPMQMNALVPLDGEGLPVTRATPGGKYERFVTFERPSTAERAKRLAQLLAPKAEPAAVVAKQP